MEDPKIQSAARPMVTVLMAVKDAERFLRPTMDSVLAQTFDRFEFLIINDGSTDATREIVLSYKNPRIRLVDNPVNMGLGASLNRGLELATSPLIARIDGDDLAHPTRLEKQVAYMERHPRVALLGAQAVTIDVQGRSELNWRHRVRGNVNSWSPCGRLAIQWRLITRNSFVHSAVMFRHEVVWTKLHGYVKGNSQDAELWSRVVVDHGYANLPEILCERRGHSGSITSNKNLRNELDKFMTVRRRNFTTFLRPPNPEDEIWLKLQAHLTLLIPLKEVGPNAGRLLLDGYSRLYRQLAQANPGGFQDAELHEVAAGDIIHAASIIAGLSRAQCVRGMALTARHYLPAFFCGAPKVAAVMVLGRGLFSRWRSNAHDRRRSKADMEPPPKNRT